LRQSILNIIDEANLKNEVSGKIVSVSYAHPLFWAPFIIVGDPGAINRYLDFNGNPHFDSNSKAEDK